MVEIHFLTVCFHNIKTDKITFEQAWDGSKTGILRVWVCLWKYMYEL